MMIMLFLQSNTYSTVICIVSRLFKFRSVLKGRSYVLINSSYPQMERTFVCNSTSGKILDNGQGKIHTKVGSFLAVAPINNQFNYCISCALNRKGISKKTEFVDIHVQKCCLHVKCDEVFPMAL